MYIQLLRKCSSLDIFYLFPCYYHAFLYYVYSKEFFVIYNVQYFLATGMNFRIVRMETLIPYYLYVVPCY